MYRRIAIAIVAAASLSTAAFIPTTASAKGGHGGHGGHGGGHGGVHVRVHVGGHGYGHGYGYRVAGGGHGWCYWHPRAPICR